MIQIYWISLKHLLILSLPRKGHWLEYKTKRSCIITHKVDKIDNIENDAVIYVMIHLMPYLSSLRPTFYALESREEG